MMFSKVFKLLANKLLKKPYVRYSALFINGAKATDTFAYVVPYVDVTQRLKQKQEVEEALKRRKCDYELNKLENLWQVYSDIRDKKSELDDMKSGVAQQLTKLIKTDPDGQEIKKLKIKSDLLKDNIRKLKVPLWSAEEAAMLEALKLPNSLHKNTPDTYKIICSHLTPPDNNLNHLEMGKKLKLITYNNTKSFYLHGDAALFELGAKFYFTNQLRTNKFTQFSNPDFVKSVIVEGCGEDHTNPDSTFILHHNEDSKVQIDSRLHLTGGATLYSFFAYFTKNVLYPKLLPCRYFSMGRQYIPTNPKENNLFNASQSSVIQMFGAAKNADALNVVLDDTINILKQAYGSLGYHFQMKYVPAHKLCSWESLRVALEMYSSSKREYIEIANISVSGDYISKRLMFTYTEDKQHKFPHIISGTILNVPKFLSCVLEQNSEFSVPEQFLIHNWKV